MENAGHWIDAVLDAIRSLGPWSAPVFIVCFVAACVLCVPVVFLTLGAGALFGVTRGFLYAWVAAQLGAAASFALGRYWFSAAVQRRLAKHPVLASIEEAVSSQGWRIVVLSRLAPGSPFFLLNYLYGITRIRFLPYLAATSISIIPGTLLFVVIGALGKDVASGRFVTAGQAVLHVAGLIALGLGTVLIARKAKANLRKRLGNAAKDPREESTPRSGDTNP